ncbi:MAG: hypothetical protein JJE49_10675 [Peptostreptococcaceae bacterium]|nr:hypothetical protein [Peptostreptococcaceae bacterium]
MLRKYSEIKNNYFDEKRRLVHIDAWKTTSNNEEGTVIATVNVDTSEVIFLKDGIEDNLLVQESIIETLAEIAANKYGNLCRV